MFLLKNNIFHKVDSLRLHLTFVAFLSVIHKQKKKQRNYYVRQSLRHQYGISVAESKTSPSATG